MFGMIAKIVGTITVFTAIVSFILSIAEQIRCRLCRRQKGTKYVSAAVAGAVPQGARRIAVITGASGGLGREYALQVDAAEKDIDEIWLIARKKEALDETAGMLKNHRALVLPMDLSLPNAALVLAERVREEHVRVGLLINCAGYGKIGTWKELTGADVRGMTDLNSRAAADITQELLPFMQAGDRVMEICSTAAFQPLGGFAVYGASKAYLLSYSRALRMELLPSGVCVTAVCPYWIRDTRFIPTAKQAEGNGRAVKNFAFSSKAVGIAKQSLRDSRWGFAVSTPGPFCTIHRIFSSFIPTEFLVYAWEVLRRI